ncbi:MAG TPA: hypothetical protein VNC22_12980 [Sporichthya sp.]|jgi:hypothetical protein|nr:hypothetical protein [Sporichthya sp.]
MHVLKSKKSKLFLATAVILALGGGSAFAYWSSGGSGTGAGSTGTSTAFTVTSTAAVGAALIPGVGTQTVGFTVTNPSTAGHQILNAVTVAVANADGTTWVPIAPYVGCSSADYTVTVTTPPAFADMAPGASTTGTATLSMNNLATLQDFCKNAPVPLYFLAS